MYSRSNLNYIESEDLYFSVLHGGGIYCWNGIDDVDPTDISGNIRCPLFMNVKTGENFLVKSILWDGKYGREYAWAVNNPAATVDSFWPVDMVDLGQRGVTEVYAESQYGLGVDPEKSGTAKKKAFLYPCRDYGVSRTVKDEMMKVDVSERKRRIELAIRILEAFKDLNGHGYLNLDIDFEHLYIRDDGRIIFPYSHLIRPLGKTDWGAGMEPEEYPAEFALPAFVRGDVTVPDLDMQNYSLAAMLFYLLMGRYAYDGELMVGIVDRKGLEHITWLEKYHMGPVFIFDSHDESNRLGAHTDAERKAIYSWNKTPEPVRNLFEKTLAKSNAERTGKFESPTPDVWLGQLSEWRNAL